METESTSRRSPFEQTVPNTSRSRRETLLDSVGVPFHITFDAVRLLKSRPVQTVKVETPERSLITSIRRTLQPVGGAVVETFTTETLEEEAGRRRVSEDHYRSTMLKHYSDGFTEAAQQVARQLRNRADEIERIVTRAEKDNFSTVEDSADEIIHTLLWMTPNLPSETLTRYARRLASAQRETEAK